MKRTVTKFVCDQRQFEEARGRDGENIRARIRLLCTGNVDAKEPLEDEKAAAKKLTTFFDRYTAEHPDVEFDITHFDDGLSLLDNYRDHYDVFLLDIQMPGINGMETAHRIREIDSEVMIIFVTNMVEYAVEGYDVRAFDFILKPVTYAAFLPKLERILRAVAIHKDAVMVKLKMKEGVQWVSSNDILYLEVSNHDVFLRLSNGTILRQPGPLSKFEKSLETVSFARNNACYLVNLKHIKGGTWGFCGYRSGTASDQQIQAEGVSLSAGTI